VQLAALHLAAGEPARAIGLAEAARARRGSSSATADFAAHPFLAVGRPTTAVDEVTDVYRGNRLAALTSSGTFVPFGDGEPVVLTIEILGASGGDRAAVRATIERLLALWSPEAVGADASSALRATSIGRVGPALIEHEDLMEAWLDRLDPRDMRDPLLRDFWTGWRAVDVAPEVAKSSLDAGLAALEGPGAEPTAIYLIGALAAALGEHQTAIDLWDRLQHEPLPVLGEFHAGWALRNLALLRRAEVLAVTGLPAEAREALDELGRRWQLAEPQIVRLLGEARAHIGA
jgi:hypothetical protein